MVSLPSISLHSPVFQGWGGGGLEGSLLIEVLSQYRKNGSSGGCQPGSGKGNMEGLLSDVIWASKHCSKLQMKYPQHRAHSLKGLGS